MTSNSAGERILIVGAGLAGAACAAAVHAGGLPVNVVERGRAPGGRLASPELQGRRVDVGAAYFTVGDTEFRNVVDRWADAGLVRPWTDTFEVFAREGHRRSTGPTRWAAPGGLRSLVRQVLTDIDVVTATEVTPESVAGFPAAGKVVLAMPDPQAARLALVPDPVPYRPTLAVVCGFAERSWSFLDAAFVNDHPDLEFLADDGARRGDGAPVLVVHTTAERARRHLDDPGSAAEPVVAALSELIGTPTPAWTHVHRWTFAKPDGRHDRPFGQGVTAGGRRVELIGDQWCPEGKPRVESAWLSGHLLGAALAAGR